MKCDFRTETKGKWKMEELHNIQVNPNDPERELWIGTRLNDEQRQTFRQFFKNINLVLHG